MKEGTRVRNSEVAAILYEVADLLEIEGVSFKPRAYRRAAQTIETLPEDVAALYARGELEDMPGIGKSIAAKIAEIIGTGRLSYLETLKKEVPTGVEDLMGVEGIGPKKALLLREKLQIQSVGDLEEAARKGKLRSMRGFGKKTEDNILEAVERHQKSPGRFLLGYILPVAQEIEERLRGFAPVERVSLSGSIRRKKETIGDVDMIAASREPKKVMDFFTGMPGIQKVLAKGVTKSTVVLTNGLQVDLRVTERSQYGAALQYFTGSKDHNIRLRALAIERGWKLNEYGLTDKDSGAVIASVEEEDIYRALGLQYIEPELREDRGEVKAAQSGTLPDLVRSSDVRGDLHVHTKWSEGSHTIEEMASAAQAMGLSYIAICDHAKTLAIARGLTEEGIRDQMREIASFNRTLDGFTVLTGIEGNIDRNGKIDISNEVLRDLDVVVASVHSGFKQSEKEMTERVVNAMHNDHVDIIGHPTGRILNERLPYRIDLSQLFRTAAAQSVCLEINAFPTRLDLSDVNCFTSREYGVRCSIGSDAHAKENLRYLEYGVATARRGWLEKGAILNTMSAAELHTWLHS
ncbi:MAG: DNA polymerase/3'-5' exonuclease PolX [Methanomicrobiales archaeon]|nr:DNA polymerase/3'-5' exonuclease PolX [Methanomicrobiales archaeon]